MKKENFFENLVNYSKLREKGMIDDDEFVLILNEISLCENKEELEECINSQEIHPDFKEALNERINKNNF
ncbi:hypothetical protein GW932_01435 [archaeon]|nr:hypothetical protein [archaeon]